MGSIALQLHKIKCLKAQEGLDEILLFGVMVERKGAITSGAVERNFSHDDPEKKYSPPLRFLSEAITVNTQTDVVICRAALWFVEKDNGKLWKDDAHAPWVEFSKRYIARLAELGGSIASSSIEVQAFKDIIPGFNKYLIDKSGGPNIDDDEVFPYINIEYRSNQLPPLHSEETDRETVTVEKAGGKYQIEFSWKLKV